jgi:hypothetical protein
MEELKRKMFLLHKWDIMKVKVRNYYWQRVEIRISWEIQRKVWKKGKRQRMDNSIGPL